jgi:hypothetical protein
VKHNWAYNSAEGILGALWLGDDMKVALMKPTWVPNVDAPMSFSALQAANEITGPGYTAGGLALAGKSTPYNAAQDRTDLVAADSTWGPGATFDAGFAVVYDNTHPSKIVWSIVDFEGTKSVNNGTLTIDWATVGLLYIVPAP